MATNQLTVDVILEQIQTLDDVRARKMFGEYALYYKEKVVGLVCNDTLFIKDTEVGHSFVAQTQSRPAYPGSKNYLPVTEVQINDSKWLCSFITATEAVLPASKKKKPKR